MYDYLRQHTDTNGSNFFIFRLDATLLGDRPLFYNLKAKMYGKRKIKLQEVYALDYSWEVILFEYG